MFSRKYTTKILKFIHQKSNFLNLKIMITVIIQNCRKKYINNDNKNNINNSNQHLLNQVIKEKVYWGSGFKTLPPTSF